MGFPKLGLLLQGDMGFSRERYTYICIGIALRVSQIVAGPNNQDRNILRATLGSPIPLFWEATVVVSSLPSIM